MSSDTQTSPPPYSSAVTVNGFLYTAGQTPHHPITDEVIGSSIAEQTEQTLINLGELLAQHGYGFEHVVKSTAHLLDIERDFAGFNEVYAKYFVEPYPVRTTVGSHLNGFLVEIDVIASLSPKS